MPGTTPELLDVYWIAFKALGYDDKKGPRPAAVVKKNPFGAVGVIGRESKKPDQWLQGKGSYVESPLENAYGFNKAGYWMSGHYKSLTMTKFATCPEHFDYRTTLKPSASTELMSFVSSCRKDGTML